jgi:long-chain acyl-CoA synthetase
MPNLAAFLAAYDDAPRHSTLLEDTGSTLIRWDLPALAQLAARWQAAFVQAGLEPGDRIALSARNSVQWAAIDFAALGLGLTVVAIDPQASARMAVTVIAHSGAELLLTDSAGRAAEILQQGGPGIGQIVILRVLQHGRNRLISLEDFLPTTDTTFQAMDLDEDHLATLSYQRMGKEKLRGVMLSHANLLASLHAQQQARLLTAGHTVLAVGSYSDLLHRVTALYLPLVCGAQVACPAASRTLDTLLQRLQPQVITARGEQLQMVANELLRSTEQHQSGQASSTSAIEAGLRVAQSRASWWDKLLHSSRPAGLQHAAQTSTDGQLQRIIATDAQSNLAARQLSLLGLPVHNGLALNMASGLVSLNLHTPTQWNTCGACLPGMEACIADNGELLLRGLALSQGYWNDPAASQADIQPEGWVHTGCRARLEHLEHQEGTQIMMESELSGTTALDTRPPSVTPLSLTQSTMAS